MENNTILRMTNSNWGITDSLCPLGRTSTLELQRILHVSNWVWYHSEKGWSFKGPDIYIGLPPLTGKSVQQRFTMGSAYWPASAVGSAAQLAAAHCPNERTLDLQSPARQTHICPSQPHYGLHPAIMLSGNDRPTLTDVWYASPTLSVF